MHFLPPRYTFQVKKGQDVAEGYGEEEKGSVTNLVKFVHYCIIHLFYFLKNEYLILNYIKLFLMHRRFWF